MKSLIVLFFFVVCLPLNAKELEVMVLNVENLFDTRHDEGKNDWTFLPKKADGKKTNCQKISYHRYRKECLQTDWTEKKLGLKINQLKRLIGRDKGKMPDILALVEVENKNVLASLAKKLGYKKFYISKGDDKRGIDQAVLFNDPDLTFKAVSEIPVTGLAFKDKPTRSIFKVHFELKDSSLFIYVNHWPSQGNPNENRLLVAKVLKNDIKKTLKLSGDVYVMALGDFNCIAENHPHPLDSILLKDGFLIDLHERFHSSSEVDKKLKRKGPLGTYFYPPKMSWNLLDRAILSPNFFEKDSKIKVSLDSYEIYAPKFATSLYHYRKGHMKGSVVTGIPDKYNFDAKSKRKAGFTDHFPVVFKLSY